MHEMTIPLKMLFSFHKHVFVQSAGKATLQKATNPHPMALGMEAWLVFSCVGHGICIAVCKVLVFLRFQSNSQRDIIQNWLIYHPIASPVM